MDLGQADYIALCTSKSVVARWHTSGSVQQNGLAKSRFRRDFHLSKAALSNSEGAR
jgi:hypothetical protein